MFWRRFGRELCLDLGTSSTLVFDRDKEALLNEPTVVAVRKERGGIEAAGQEAKAMIGRAPGHLQVIFPVQDGVIGNYDMAAAMLKHFFEKIGGGRWFFSARVAASVPCGLTNVQRRAVEEAVIAAGARKVLLIDNPLAAAVGAGLPVHQPVGSIVLDIGGGKTEAAIVSLGGIVVSNTVRTGSQSIDKMIINYLKDQYSLAIGDLTAERLKMAARCSADGATTIEIRGLDLASGIPKTVRIDLGELNRLVDPFVRSVVRLIRQTMEKCPPELAGDVVERGILLCGGGAKINGLEERLRQELEVPVYLAGRPEEAVVLGLAKIMDAEGGSSLKKGTNAAGASQIAQGDEEEVAAI